MIRSMVWISAALLALAVACSSEDAKNSVDSATEAAESMPDVAANLGERADAAAGAVATNAVAACRQLAESGSWGDALEVCKKAHEMMPDDLGIEHAYQQAQAAAR